MAQELLTTFGDELGEVALVPGDGGLFQVHVGDDLIACRARDGGFPELAELKRGIRDRVAPGRDLGHSDRPQQAERARRSRFARSFAPRRAAGLQPPRPRPRTCTPTGIKAGTVVIVTADEGGAQRDTTIWLCVLNGQGYVRGGSGQWVANTLRHGDVRLRVGEQELSLRATRLTDAVEIERVTAAFREKYGFSDTLATLIRGEPTIFRLTPR
jgi:selenoprotein W-related protein